MLRVLTKCIATIFLSSIWLQDLIKQPLVLWKCKHVIYTYYALYIRTMQFWYSYWFDLVFRCYVGLSVLSSLLEVLIEIQSTSVIHKNTYTNNLILLQTERKNFNILQQSNWEVTMYIFQDAYRSICSLWCISSGIGFSQAICWAWISSCVGALWGDIP